MRQLSWVFFVVLTAGLHQATAVEAQPVSVTIADFDNFDTAGEGAQRTAEHAERVKAFANLLRIDLAAEGRYRVEQLGCSRLTVPGRKGSSRRLSAGSAELRRTPFRLWRHSQAEYACPVGARARHRPQEGQAGPGADLFAPRRHGRGLSPGSRFHRRICEGHSSRLGWCCDDALQLTDVPAVRTPTPRLPRPSRVPRACGRSGRGWSSAGGSTSASPRPARPPRYRRGRAPG